MAALHDVAVERLYSVRLLYTIVQGFFGVRAISYMLLSLIIGMAIPITIAGNLEVINRTIAPSWARIYWVLSAVVASLMVFHIFILPKDSLHANLPIWTGVTHQWWHDVKSAFVRRPHYVASLCSFSASLSQKGCSLG